MRAALRADLHAHTTASDGTLSPTALVELAARVGLGAIAVTDHDHVGGLDEARAAGARLGVEVIAGIELSVTHPVGDVHLLGYFVDDRSPPLLAELARLRDVRERRAEIIVERLNALGVAVTLAEVEREAAGGALGRPHVARALVKRGAVASVAEAFDRYLADGRPAAVPKAKLSARDAIALLHAAGGVAVLAHAVTIPEASREPLVRELSALGLDGLEVHHSKHDATMREALGALASELRLVPTGGSDFHGENKPDVALGSVTVGAEVVAALRGRAKRSGPRRG